MKGILGWAVCWLVAVSPVSAQQAPVVRGHFETDTISIGQVVSYSLTARYSRNQQVIFPDSTYSFSPFDFSKKKYSVTRSSGESSYDSVVYLLTTFEIDSIQRLKLPVFMIQEQDCVAVYSASDSLRLNYRVASVPDSVSAERLPLKANTVYQKVKWILNYPVYLLILLVLTIVGVVVWIIFGKRIRIYFAIRRLEREYRFFMERFSSAIDALGSGFSSRRAEETLVVWKNYMEHLEKNPYTKFTSREIVQLVSDQHLDSALRAIDRGIYGGQGSAIDSFRFLQSYSEKRFQLKEAEVRNG